ncbi:hypothetical protein ACFVS2_20720 [Brevibacillus sp. NPDC058079]|uniref:hypothetical protein n=1 Tax=Brevibacillus sp. NPDC058079 TaxID=3346330 RepID=UPI0036F0418A
MINKIWRICAPCISIISLVLLLSACDLDEMKKQATPPVIFKGSKVGWFTSPQDVEIQYFTSNDREKEMGGAETLIVFKYINGRFPYYSVFPVKQTQEGYSIIGTDYESFSVPDPRAFGFSAVQKLDKKNGTFKMTFENTHQYEKFLEGVEGWYRVLDYYKSLENASRTVEGSEASN